MAKLKTFKEMKEYLELEEAKDIDKKDLQKAGWPFKKVSDVPKDMLKLAVKDTKNASVDEINAFLEVLAG